MPKKYTKKFRPEKQAEPNLFERLKNKKRFDVIGRKVKGETRHMGKLRSEATERRKSTLLVEYKQLRKSNAFIDRRFGEDDESLTAEERAILRFQKQRMREMAGGKFSLPDEDNQGGDEGGEMLTHLGRSLAELQDINDGWASDDDHYDKKIDAQMTADLNFGGGLFTRKQQTSTGGGDEDQQPEERHRTRKEVMEEVMAKSKAYKAMKQQQREEDLTATDALDAKFKELTSIPGFAGLMRPKGEKPSNKADDAEDRKFDVLTKELLFEAKAKPGERTLSAEELAELEKQRLEVLEKQRVKRQRNDDTHGGGGGDDLEDDFQDGDEGYNAGAGVLGEGGEGGIVKGGYAARRAKRAKLEEIKGKKRKSHDDSDDDGDTGSEEDDEDEDESEGDSDDSEGLTALEKRRRDRARGDHPLQFALREAAARLLAKHGLANDSDDNSGSEGGSEEEEGSDIESGSDDGSDGKSDDTSEEEGESSSDDDDDDHEQQQQEEQQLIEPKNSKPSKTTTKKPTTTNTTDVPTLSFTPPLPTSYTDFAQQAQGLSASDLGELLRRIRAFNAAELNVEGKKKAQVLYGCIVQHFVILAGADVVDVDSVDGLLPHILELTAQVPFYAVTLARARLHKAQQQLSVALKDPLFRYSTAWPATKTLLLLKLLTVIFPVSDKRHPVLTAATLYITQALAQCPIVHPRDAATGMYLASLGLHMHAGSGRYIPEPVSFAVSILQAAAAVHTSSTGCIGTTSDSGTISSTLPQWLSLSSIKTTTKKLLPQTEDALPTLELTRLLTATDNSDNGGGTEGYWESDGFKLALVSAAAKLIERATEVWSEVDVLPEMMGPAVHALQHIIASASPGSSRSGRDDDNVLPNGVGGMANGIHKSSTKSKKKQKLDTTTATIINNKQAPTTTVAIPGICPGLVQLCTRILTTLQQRITTATTRRQPLSLKSMLALPTAKTFNPRFEEEFALGKDFDPDRERADRRRLQRQIRKEERGAMRELRRDAAFMSGVRDKEKYATQDALDQSAKRAMSFLQQQESDFKSGGQKGMWKKKSGRK